MEVTVIKVVHEEINARYFCAEMHVRYPEDGKYNGVEDEDGTLMPFLNNGVWKVKIDIDTGQIVGWPGGEASIHYKVCDAGKYWIVDDKGNIHCEKEGYVPDVMCPGGRGYGDYVIMNINNEGYIENWNLRNVQRYVAEHNQNLLDD